MAHLKKNKSTIITMILLVAIAVVWVLVEQAYPALVQHFLGNTATPIPYGEPESETDAYVHVNGNIPYFTDVDKASTRPFENYSELDSFGRCGVAYANLCLELMPTGTRGPIGNIKPSGWQTAKYDFIDGKYLYNRCHLIGFQLAAENDNPKNLITGTRYLSTKGMLPFENAVADYIRKTGNHVLYRVTPVFEGWDLVARGVLMEGWSIEDNGDGVCFCVYVYNKQPGVYINYRNGDNAIHAPSPDA